MNQADRRVDDTILTQIHEGWKTHILATLVRLGLPDLLIKGPQTVVTLAEQTGTQSPLLYRLLLAAASVDVVDILPGSSIETHQFRSNDYTTKLTRGKRDWFLLQHLWSPKNVTAWSQMETSLVSGKPSINHVLGMSIWEHLEQDQEASFVFHGAMSALSDRAIPAIVKSYDDFPSLSVLVDIGGGIGAMLAAILQANPNLQGIIADRADVQENAYSYLANIGMEKRCHFEATNFFERLPSADAYFAKNIFHDWNDQDSLTILRVIRRAALPEARLLIAEVLLPEAKDVKSVVDSNFPMAQFIPSGLDLDMMIETGGRQRTATEFSKLLDQADFTVNRVIQAGRSPFHILEASTR